MEKSALFQEIFGNDDVAPVTPVKTSPVTSLPFDNPLYPYSKGTGKADSLCRELEDSAFVAEVSGLTCDEARKIVSPNSTLPETGTEIIKRILGERRSAARREGLSRLIAKTRNNPRLASIRNSDGWERLLSSCEQFVLASV